MQIENQHAADDPTATLLERLLAERLPRRWRCGSCVAFEAAAADALEGECAARVRGRVRAVRGASIAAHRAAPHHARDCHTIVTM
jgi:hypothetical protein